MSNDSVELQGEPLIRERTPSDPPPPQTLEAAFPAMTLEEIQDAAAEELCARAQAVSERYPEEIDGNWIFAAMADDDALLGTNEIAADIETLLQFSGMLVQINEGLAARVEELEAELAQVSRSHKT